MKPVPEKRVIFICIAVIVILITLVTGAVIFSVNYVRSSTNDFYQDLRDSYEVTAINHDPRLQLVTVEKDGKKYTCDIPAVNTDPLECGQTTFTSLRGNQNSSTLSGS